VLLLGHPVSHSLSPVIQNAAIAAAGIDARYDALDVAPLEFAETIARLKAEGVAGNVTIPHKERMRAACDRVTDLAHRVGAVNTFWVDNDGLLVGDNTDVGGFNHAASEVLPDAPRDLSVGILGAGGAAAAVLAAVEGWPGCTAHVYNRTPERARILCERFGSFAQPADDVGVVAGADLLVNATSIGLRDGNVPIDLSLLRREIRVVDLVYRPDETRFVFALRSRGIKATGGLSMLVEQAVLAFERWFGPSIDHGTNRAVMWSALRDRSTVS
jgi:shikimate dehydrogenase